MANQYTAKSYITDTEAQCCVCKQIKSISNFYIDKKNIYRKQVSYACKECTKERSRLNHNTRVKVDIKYKLSKKDQYLKSKYGISLEEYNSKLQIQKYCAICGIELNINNSNAHLDHDHLTGNIRSFLCGNCNRGIGSFHDEIWKMKKAIQYLEQYGKTDISPKEGSRL